MLPISVDWQNESVDPLVQLGLMTGGVVILSLIVALVFVRRAKPKIGLLAGLAIIALAWAISEIRVIGACIQCRSEPLCCEWTAVGVVTFALLGIVAVVGYLALAIGGIAIHRALITPTQSNLRRSPSRSGIRLWLSSIGVPLFTAVVAASVLSLANEGLIRGHLVGWHPVDGPNVPDARAALKAGDRINAQTTSGLCELVFHVNEPPGRVSERADAISCNAAAKRQTSYVLLDNGSYWEWRHSINSDLSVLLGRLGSVFLGALSGFVLGVIFARKLLTRSA